MFARNPTEEFKEVRIKLSPPAKILSTSYGEVTKPETINYRTQRPEKDGLFDEKIFGPIKDWECYCGKYKRIRYKGIVCDRCGVEVTRSSVRRERMGHIQLAVPVAHIWFLRGVPSRLGLILELSVQDLEKIVYFASYIVTSVNENERDAFITRIDKEFKIKKAQIDQRYEQLIAQAKTRKGAKGKDIDLAPASPKRVEAGGAEKETEVATLKDSWQNEIKQLENIRDLARAELRGLKTGQIISELEYRDLSLKYGPVFEAGIGAESLLEVLTNVDLEKLTEQLEHELVDAEGLNRRKVIRRLKLAKSMFATAQRPEWMLISTLPVIPPELRPMVQLDGGRFAASDLNDLYRRVINRNNRLKKLLEIKAPEVIVRNEKRMLQEAVDALIDNSMRHGKEVTASTGQRRKLRSLADMLKGKQGRFRQNLLGKRVDYSGRSVIVVGPHLRLDQCGLPKKMALELFKPFVIGKLISREYAHNVRSANRLIEQGRSEVYDILEEVTRDHYVLLNRAPTLHRLGFQAFKPILIEGKAIQIHPMVCPPFNADFDGDQMAVHVPLTAAAQTEAREIMCSAKNLLKPASGDPIMTADKDLVLGCFYITQLKSGAVGEGKSFADTEEALLAYQLGMVDLRVPIKVRIPTKPSHIELIETSIGRILFNNVLPESMRFRNDVHDKGKLRQVIRECYNTFGVDRCAQLLDDIKKLGFYYATVSGISWGMADLKVPDIKEDLIHDAENEIREIYDQHQQGLLTETERYQRVIETWTGVVGKITTAVKQEMDEFSSIYTIVTSGARASLSQVVQMSGIKGVVVNPEGAPIELPVKDSFKEGLSPLEYFISTHGARKGLSDTALRTADAGYLTRRLVDVAQDMVINQWDCGTEEDAVITRAQTEAMRKSTSERVFGRVASRDIKDSKGKVLVAKDNPITEELSHLVEKEDIDNIRVRSVLGCKLVRGICALCYGYDLGYNRMVDLGAAVGIVAAQAIGEPGTQLTMRTFHSGGVAGLDITQGLPRVEELFEARTPKGQSYLSEIDGNVKIVKATSSETVLRIESGEVVKDEYRLAGSTSQIADGEKVTEGDPLLIDVDGNTMRATSAGIVRYEDDKKGRKLVVVHESENYREYSIPSGMNLSVRDGDLVVKGQPLTEGHLNLDDLMSLRGREAVQDYIISDIQDIYSSQGQRISDKHIELIVKQMFSKVRVLEPGSSDLLVGDVLDYRRVDHLNNEIKEKGGELIQWEQ
ncbi:MAG: DNA-directed RNA polymerase subunit beta', partial [Candidatus Doudnabacteria bacterium RIFCSPHIGHO2_02_FULL_46_11]